MRARDYRAMRNAQYTVTGAVQYMY